MTLPQARIAEGLRLFESKAVVDFTSIIIDVKLCTGTDVSRAPNWKSVFDMFLDHFALAEKRRRPVFCHATQTGDHDSNQTRGTKKSHHFILEKCPTASVRAYILRHVERRPVQLIIKVIYVQRRRRICFPNLCKLADL